MSTRTPGRILRWQATAILTLFFCAVAGAAAVGWWYARESLPHPGPIVLISVDALSPSSLHAYSAPDTRATPGLDALAGDAVVFDRAYTHSPLTLPAQASLLSGRLPFEHGVRDDAGFTLGPGARTLAELLRNRGFKTGGAVSSFLLRRSTGIAQGFTSYAESPDDPIALELYRLRTSSRPPYLTTDDTAGDPLAAAIESSEKRAGVAAVDEAERWARAQQGHRYFLFLEVGADQAEEAVARIAGLLQQRRLYDQATIVLVGSTGRGGPGQLLEEEALHVPLLIKQPHREGAGRRVAIPVQHIDLLPTILDLVRAPIPGSLAGRSLQGLLTDEHARIVPRAIYSESLAAYFRFGGHPLFGLTVNGSRYVRGMTEQVEQIDAAGVSAGIVPTARPAPALLAGERVSELSDALAPLRATLDRFLAGHPMVPPGRIADADLERLALAGYLPGLRPMPGVADVRLDDTAAQQPLALAHQRAARLVGQRRLPAAIHVLQRMAREQPAAAALHYQIGILSAALGRTQEATTALDAAATLRPDAPEVPEALAATLVASGRASGAMAQAELAVTLAELLGPREVSIAHQLAARAALAHKDQTRALMHADAAQTADPALPMRAYVEGRLLVEAGQFDSAVRLLQEAAAMLRQHDSSLEGLHTTLAAALAGANRSAEAEAACRDELRAFPRSLTAFTTLARLAGATHDEAKVESVVEALLAAVPTPEGYAAAVRVWRDLGAQARADALRSDARARFQGDPPLAQLPARDGRR